MSFKIEKILNNNAAVILNDKGQETVIMGRGIAFQKKIHDMIPCKMVEKKFTLAPGDMSGRFQELVADVPLEHILVSEQIISYAKKTLGKEFSDTIYIALTDHITSAIQRHNEGIILKNTFLWDIRQFHHDEFQIGIKAVEIIRDDLGVEFLEDEAAFITLHLVSAQLDGNMTLAHEATKLIQEITNIVKYHFQIEFDSESLSYYRFVSHLRFLAQRMSKGKNYCDDNEGLLLFVIDKHPKAYNCAKTIGYYIRQRYEYKLSEEELLYMTVHISRVVKEARRNKTEKTE